MTSIDSNGVLRWLLDDVPGAADKVERRLASDGPLKVADVALVEVVFVLEKLLGISRRTVADSVGAVLGDARFSCDRDIWRAVVKTWADRPKLSVVDVYLAEIARRGDDVPLLTFDRKLANQVDVAELV
ncbi:MAG: PIN domain-containing protein [Nocardioidaceae bacterium]